MSRKPNGEDVSHVSISFLIHPVTAGSVKDEILLRKYAQDKTTIHHVAGTLFRLAKKLINMRQLLRVSFYTTPQVFPRTLKSLLLLYPC